MRARFRLLSRASVLVLSILSLAGCAHGGSTAVGKQQPEQTRFPNLEELRPRGASEIWASTFRDIPVYDSSVLIADRSLVPLRRETR